MIILRELDSPDWLCCTVEKSRRGWESSLRGKYYALVGRTRALLCPLDFLAGASSFVSAAVPTPLVPSYQYLERFSCFFVFPRRRECSVCGGVDGANRRNREFRGTWLISDFAKKLFLQIHETGFLRQKLFFTISRKGFDSVSMYLFYDLEAEWKECILCDFRIFRLEKKNYFV